MKRKPSLKTIMTEANEFKRKNLNANRAEVAEHLFQTFPDSFDCWKAAYDFLAAYANRG